MECSHARRSLTGRYTSRYVAARLWVSLNVGAAAEVAPANVTVVRIVPVPPVLNRYGRHTIGHEVVGGARTDPGSGRPLGLPQAGAGGR